MGEYASNEIKGSLVPGSIFFISKNKNHNQYQVCKKINKSTSGFICVNLYKLLLKNMTAIKPRQLI